MGEKGWESGQSEFAPEDSDVTPVFRLRAQALNIHAPALVGLPASHPPTVAHRSLASGPLPCLNSPSTLSLMMETTLAQSAQDSRTKSYSMN